MYEYRCKIVKVIDGDTVDVDIDLGFGVWMKKERVRMMGLDTPESRTRDLEEKRFGNMAKDFVLDKLPIGSDQILKTFKDETGKFGRILGDFIIDDNVSLVEAMIHNRLGVAYHGQSKDLIEQAHLDNRKYLIQLGFTDFS